MKGRMTPPRVLPVKDLGRCGGDETRTPHPGMEEYQCIGRWALPRGHTHTLLKLTDQAKSRTANLITDIELGTKPTARQLKGGRTYSDNGMLTSAFSMF